MGRRYKGIRQRSKEENRELASKGGKARAKRLTPEELSRIGLKGATATYLKYGTEHYKMMARKRYGGRSAGPTVTEKGYVRITSGKDKGQYEHRLEVGRLADEFCYYSHKPARPPCYYYLSGKRRRFEVHHLNGNRSDNRPENLVLMDADLHRACTLEQFRYNSARRCFDSVPEDADI